MKIEGEEVSMSETVHYRGRLKKVEKLTDKSLEQQCERIARKCDRTELKNIKILGKNCHVMNYMKNVSLQEMICTKFFTMIT